MVGAAAGVSGRPVRCTTGLGGVENPSIADRPTAGGGLAAVVVIAAVVAAATGGGPAGTTGVSGVAGTTGVSGVACDAATAAAASAAAATVSGEAAGENVITGPYSPAPSVMLTVGAVGGSGRTGVTSAELASPPLGDLSTAAAAAAAAAAPGPYLGVDGCPPPPPPTMPLPAVSASVLVIVYTGPCVLGLGSSTADPARHCMEGDRPYTPG